METKAEEILRKLCVRSGLQITTYILNDFPLAGVDMFYDRDDCHFKLRLFWPNNRKVITLPETEVYSKGRSPWKADNTWRLTEASIARLSPGLDSAIAVVLERIERATGKGEGT